VFFSAIVLLVMLPIGFRESSVTLGTQWMWWVALCAAGALYMPVALIHAFLPRTRHPFVIYIAIQFVFVMLVAVAALLDGFKMTDLRLLVAVIPTCGLLLSGSDAIGDTHLHSLIVATGSVTAASICLLLVKMWAPWRQIAVWEKAAAELPPARSIDASDPQPAE
jgi:drug/metabolite transporter (DMT)-like permease